MAVIKMRQSMTFLVNNIAREIAGENDGKIPDIFTIEARLKAALLKNPERLDLDRYVKSCRKEWAKLNHEVLIPDGLTGVRFVPGAFLTVGKRALVIMKKAEVADMVAWQQVDDDAEANFLKTVRSRSDYRNARLREFAANRDCRYLGDIETKLHGYVETQDDEQAHFSVPPRADPDDLAATA